MSKSLGDVPVEVSRARKSNPSEGSSVRESVNIAQGTVVGTSKGIGRILAAGFRSPFEVTLAAAKGFRNVPALYGDETVRPAERITGIKSGLATVGKVSNNTLCSVFILTGIGTRIQPIRWCVGFVHATY